MREIAVIGIGMHPWGKWPEKNHLDLGTDAIEMALKDASLEWKDIQFMVSGVSSQQPGVEGITIANDLAERLGNQGIPVANIYNACATGNYALKIGQAMVASGFCDKVLVVGTDKSPGGFFVPKESSSSDTTTLKFEIVGSPNPASWALVARRRMHEVGTTETDLAQVKVKNSKHGALNPNARYRKIYTLEEVMNSAMVCDPLRLYEICATSDGAAAVILCSLEEAKKHTAKPIILSSVSCASPRYPEPEVNYGIFSQCVKKDAPVSLGSHSEVAPRRAFEDAGVGPQDLDFAEVYDLSTSMELIWYEQIGLCKHGEAEKLLRDGATSLGGRIPVNTSGGVSSFGEAIPAQALCQIYEVVTQLRGDAGARQVKDAKVGLAVNIGNFGNCSAAILKR